MDKEKLAHEAMEELKTELHKIVVKYNLNTPDGRKGYTDESMNFINGWYQKYSAKGLSYAGLQIAASLEAALLAPISIKPNLVP